ncbi:hypothetical protein J8273_4534 [Carpediemonas membranifera]|uniref:Uncharacterized protein n=1 Tax=Carpediemonas membranifera TaxID=201153 RepID=A0A8J6B458_9EUKA|nr:hypothetical protein J8273_4534 [Carpediemonas membranifera]|eukprot:KAG9393934.1 hypothetical protein J8273_4534 [Carpediemonas membranifera]
MQDDHYDANTAQSANARPNPLFPAKSSNQPPYRLAAVSSESTVWSTMTLTPRVETPYFPDSDAESDAELSTMFDLPPARPARGAAERKNTLDAPDLNLSMLGSEPVPSDTESVDSNKLVVSDVDVLRRYSRLPKDAAVSQIPRPVSPIRYPPGKAPDPRKDPGLLRVRQVPVHRDPRRNRSPTMRRGPGRAVSPLPRVLQYSYDDRGTHFSRRAPSPKMRRIVRQYTGRGVDADDPESRRLREELEALDRRLKTIKDYSAPQPAAEDRLDRMERSAGPGLRSRSQIATVDVDLDGETPRAWAYFDPMPMARGGRAISIDDES